MLLDELAGVAAEVRAAAGIVEQPAQERLQSGRAMLAALTRRRTSRSTGSGPLCPDERQSPGAVLAEDDARPANAIPRSTDPPIPIMMSAAA